VRALGMGFCVVELNNKNEMSISSLFMLLIWLCGFRVGVTKGLFLLIRVVELFWCWILINISSHRNKVIYFSYLLWFEVLNKFLWNCYYDRLKKFWRWWKLSWEVDG
jgi:hypothetical protein